jgi:aminoglycoside phosphotransferase
MMSFIDEHEFESVWNKLRHSIPRNNALNACHSDICVPTGVH